MSLSAFDLKGRVALVTGGGRGIGRGLALGLAEAGADVLVVSRHLEQCEATAEAIRALGRRGVALEADVAASGEAGRVVAETVRLLGRLDVLVNNAGTSEFQASLELTEEDWDRVLDTNLRATFFWAQAAARVMVSQGGGKILNISSVSAAVGESKMAAYCASKAGVTSLTKTLAREWARHNIQVNSLAPGYVVTDLNEATLRDEKVREVILSAIPARRLGEVDDLLGAAVFLASAASDYVTGHTLYVDGGRLTGTRGG